jgi:NitT/TauT family transport system substrate-binding protein
MTRSAPAVLALLGLLLAACGGTAAPVSSPSQAAPTQSPAPAKPAASVAGSAASSAKPVASASTKPAAAGAGEKVKVAITSGSVTGAGVYIALDRGYYREAGLDVEIVPFPGGAQMISSVAASQVDVANTDAGAGLLNAISRELPMRFVADGSHCDSQRCGTAFTVRKDLVDSGKFKDLKDLKGLTVNFSTQGSTLYQFSNRMLDKAGLKPPDLKVQNLTGFPDILPAYSNKGLDASWLIEPFIAQGAEQGLLAKYQTAAEMFGPQQNTVIVYAPNFSTQRVDAGKKFMTAYIRGLRDWIDAVDRNKDYDAIIGIMTKESSLKDPAIYKKIALPAFDPNGALFLDAIKVNQQWYVDHGDVKNPIDVDKIYDPRYLEYAVGQLGKR